MLSQPNPEGLRHSLVTLCERHGYELPALCSAGAQPLKRLRSGTPEAWSQPGET